MDRIQIALLVIAAYMLLESCTGILAPGFIKRMSASLTGMSEKTSPVMGVLLLLVAVVLWVLLLADLSLDRWVLLFIGAGIAGLGYTWLRPGSLQKFLTRLIVDRSETFIRLFFIGELVVAALILWVVLLKDAAAS